MSSAAGPWVDQWLSTPRFAVYLRAANNDRTRALALYEWNASTGAALQHDLAHLEVALRNAYDTAITTHTARTATHWTKDPGRLFPVSGVPRGDKNRVPRDQIDKAMRNAGGSNAPAGKVIAELSFGFWRYMTIRRHDQRLWVPYLHHAFSAGTARREVDVPVGRLHKLRNRIAHHEPLLRENLADRHGDVLDVAALLSPELAAHLVTTSQVPELDAARP